MMNIVLCVLKDGNWKNRHVDVSYSSHHVRLLKAQVEQHLSLPHDFICLTDMDVPSVQTTKLKHGWPGWWSKMELFRPDLYSENVRYLYLDLDTVITGSLDEIVLAADHGFCALASMFKKPGIINSGLMAWTKNPSHLYEKFCEKPEFFMEDYSHDSSRWGDQGFVQEHMPDITRFQEVLPEGSILSYKCDVMKMKQPPERKPSIVCFHGQPKPWDVTLPDWLQ